MSIFSDDSALNSKDEKRVVDFVQQQLLQPAQKFRQKMDMRWFVYNSYYDGNTWLMYNKLNGKWENIYLEQWRNKISIPEAFVSHRSIKSIILNKDPVYDVVPVKNDTGYNKDKGKIHAATGQNLGESEDGPKVKAAKLAGGILEYLEYKIDLKKKRDDVADDALKMGNGYWKIGFDQEAEDGAGEVSVNRVSPYSIYLDPVTTDPTSFENSRFVIYVVPRDVTYIKLKYDKDVKPDNKDSSSNYEEMYKRQSVGYGDKKRVADTVLVYECWVRVPRREKLPNGEYIVKYTMRCITCTENEMLRDVEDPLKINEFPFEVLQINYKPGEPYADGNIKYQKDMIDQINKRLSQTADSSSRMSLPRILAPKGSINQEEFTDKPGQIVEYTIMQGQKPEVMQGSSVSKDVMDLVNYLGGKVQDAAGIHDVSRGIMPQGLTSGRQLELAQSADTMVLGPYIKALESFLQRAAKKMLKIVKSNYPSQKSVIIRGKQGVLRELEIVPSDIDFSDVRVEIASFLANTKAARQDIILQLFQAGAIGPKTLLQNYEFPDIEAVVQDLQDHNANQQMNPQAMQRAPSPAAQLPGAGNIAPSENPAFQGAA